MSDLRNAKSPGTAPGWPSRIALIKDLRHYTPSTMDHAAAYNARIDERNKNNAVAWSSYQWRGTRRQSDAIASALEGRDEWTRELGESLRDLMFSDQLSYFWHGQFRVLFPTHSRPLGLMDWVAMTNSMAFSFLLGWKEQAIYQGYLTYAALNSGYQLRESYEHHHRHAHAFMLRLFALWRHDGVTHTWPSWGVDVAVYNNLLEHWRDPDPRALAPWLLAACDRHVEQARYDTEENQYDFGDYRLTRTPIEILMVLRLRELSGLQILTIDHPLMEGPFDRCPAQLPTVAPDELMQGTLKRAREDWPDFDRVTSFGAVFNLATKTGALQS